MIPLRRRLVWAAQIPAGPEHDTHVLRTADR